MRFSFCAPKSCACSGGCTVLHSHALYPAHLLCSAPFGQSCASSAMHAWLIEAAAQLCTAIFSLHTFHSLCSATRDVEAGGSGSPLKAPRPGPARKVAAAASAARREASLVLMPVLPQLLRTHQADASMVR